MNHFYRSAFADAGIMPGIVKDDPKPNNLPLAKCFANIDSNSSPAHDVVMLGVKCRCALSGGQRHCYCSKGYDGNKGIHG